MLQVLLPHRDDAKLETAVVSQTYLAVFERIHGLQAATIFHLPAAGKAPESLEHGDQVGGDSLAS